MKCKDSIRWARWYWKKWSARAMRSKLEPIKRFVRTIRNHEELIFNFSAAKKEFTSGVVEGLNRKVNAVTRKAYGFRREEVYRIVGRALRLAIGTLDSRECFGQPKRSPYNLCH